MASGAFDSEVKVTARPQLVYDSSTTGLVIEVLHDAYVLHCHFQMRSVELEGGQEVLTMNSVSAACQ